MPGVNGREANAGYAFSNTWGVPASVTRGILLQSTDGLDAMPTLVDDDAFNVDFLGDAEVGDFAPTSQELALTLRYEDVPPWIAAACGSVAAPVVVSSIAADSLIAYRHTITLAPELTKFITLAVDTTQYVLEVPTARIRGFNIRVGDGGVMQCAFQITGNKSTYNSTVNTNSTVAGVAGGALGNRVFRKSGTFRMNVQGAGALGASDVSLLAKEITFGTSRPVAEDHVFGLDYIIEPDDDGFVEFPVEITFARMNTVSANSLAVGLAAGRNWKADFDFLGPYVNSTTQREFKFEFPNLQLYSFKAAIVGHGVVRPVAQFKAKLAASSPAGMAFVNPMQITVINASSTALLS